MPFPVSALSVADRSRRRRSSYGIGFIMLVARRCTVIVVVYRLSTIRPANHIVFIEDGRTAKEGTHETPMARNGRYGTSWTKNQRSAPV